MLHATYAAARREQVPPRRWDAANPVRYLMLDDGARGAHFIEKTVESSHSERKWTDAMFA